MESPNDNIISHPRSGAHLNGSTAPSFAISMLPRQLPHLCSFDPRVSGSMLTQTPSFVPATPVSTRRLTFLQPATCRTAPRRVPRGRPLCVAQEGKTQPSSQSQIPSNESNSHIPQETQHERKERARKARMEAERLELMAAKARLEQERAELQAERKRLELEKVKTLKDLNVTRGGAPSTANTAIENPYDKPDMPDTDSEPKAEQKKDIPPKLTASNISEMLRVEFPRVSEKDIETIKEKLCGMNTFFITEVDRSPFDERVVFRGNMRLPSDVVLAELERLAEEEGIAERVRLFLLYDPKEGADEEDDKRPVLVALPSAATPNQTNTFSAVFSVILGLASVFTTFSYGIGIFGLTPEVISQIAKGSLEDAVLTLPVSVGAISLALLHDAAHRVVASFRGVKLGLPFFIPSLQIGTYGTITPLESYPKRRSDLFDVAVAGPLAGSLASIVALVAGLVITGSGEIADWFPQVPSALFHASILIGSIADLILPAGVREQATIAVHPLAVVGYTGLLVNALNLMPIGRLDGGRIVQALYGRAVAGRATAITLLIQGASSLVGNSPLILFWGLICVFLQRESDFPCQNEVIEPDNTRTVIGLGALCMMLLVLIPFPDQIGDILGRY